MEQLSFDTEQASINTLPLLRIVRERKEDYEWYPTTQEQIDCIIKDIQKHTYTLDPLSVLDCGAGDGRVLCQLTEGDRYAIEISETLRNLYPANVTVLGTDFHAQTLIDKRVDLIFSNSPYLEFVSWATKILTEAFSDSVVLIMPQRWKKKADILGAMKLRGWQEKVLGTFSYEYADRQANVVVDVVRFFAKGNSYYKESSSSTDPFDAWFDTTFPDIKKSSGCSLANYQIEGEIEDRMVDHLTKSGSKELVTRFDEVTQICSSYDTEMNSIFSTYNAISNLPQDVIRELGGADHTLRSRLKFRLKSIKSIYWRRLFDSLPELKQRLTASTRKELLCKIESKANLDLTSDNVRAIVMWALKNTSTYLDSQFLETMVKLDDAVNVQLYKSNRSLFANSNRSWRWQKEDGAKYYFEYRMVLDPIYSFGLVKREEKHSTFSTGEMLVDLMAIAYNLGFDCIDNLDPMAHKYKSGEKVEFFFKNEDGEREVLFVAKVFKKGSMHLTFNQNFMTRINVEMGRLKGWIVSAKQASDELGITEKAAASAFCSMKYINLETDTTVLLGHK
ncbi:DUF4942 domain-containing protein [Vibrio sp. R78045]|uniref:class I SAM-dependent methyltransferase n=1 Tax=Vibrio sp. R78045 TaxID=3093868 RepID=UPI0036F2E6D8